MLRVEATELKKEQMFVEQKRAYERMKVLIRDAIAQRDQSRRAEHQRDQSKHADIRTNRTIFLSGISGTGKTSMYLSLRATRQDAERRDKPDDQNKSDEDWREKVVWLEPMELFSAKRTPNALADLLVLIENEIDGELATLSSTKKKTLQGLQRIQNKVSMVWDASTESAPANNAQARAAQIVDASRERASLRKDLNELIGEISREFFDNKVIILPIDDLDESHHSAFDVLRLLRLVHSPSLLVLAIGDMTTLKKIEEARIRSESTDRALQDNEVKKQYSMMAEHSINKLIPSAQRVNLEPPETEGDENWDALKEFAPLSWKGGKEKGGLVNLLRTQLAQHGLTAFSDSNQSTDQETQWRWLFKAPVRDLVDMHYSLLQISEETDGEIRHELLILFIWSQIERAANITDWPNGDASIFHHLFRTELEGSLKKKFTLRLNEQYASTIVPNETDTLFAIERKNGVNIQLAPLIQAWLRLCHEIGQLPPETQSLDTKPLSTAPLRLRLRWLPHEYPDGNPHSGTNWI